MSANLRQGRVVYEGDVQGVGFRYTVRGIAQRLGVSGGVENLPDGTVHLVAEGPEEVVQQLLLQIRVSRLGPHVTEERIQWADARGLAGFYYR